MLRARSTSSSASLRRTLGKLLAPPLLLVLVYSFIIVRPLIRQASQHRKSVENLEKNVAELKEREQRLKDELAVATTSSAPITAGTKTDNLVHQVGHQGDSPVQLSSRLMEYVKRNQLECLQITSFDTPDAEHPNVDLRLELVGPFERFKAMLTQLASEQDGMVVSGLRMSRQDSGLCRWQVDVQFEGGVL